MWSTLVFTIYVLSYSRINIIIQIFAVFSLTCLVLGGAMDSLNIIWGYQSEYGKYKSGVPVLPAFLYIIGVALSKIDFLIKYRYYVIFALMLFHIISYVGLPWLFFRINSTKNFKHAVKALDVDKAQASQALHAAKKTAGHRGADNIFFSKITGEIIPKTGGVIGNLFD